MKKGKMSWGRVITSESEETVFHFLLISGYCKSSHPFLPPHEVPGTDCQGTELGDNTL